MTGSPVGAGGPSTAEGPATTDGAAAPPGARYAFGPRETRGVLLGLRGPQLGVLTAGLAALVAGMSAGAGGAAAGMLAAAAAVAAVAVPVGGRTVEQWAPVAAGFAAQRLTGQHVYRRPPIPTAAGRDPEPGDGAARPAGALRGPDGGTPLGLPGPLARLRLLAVPVDGDRQVAVVKDPTRGTYTAVVALAGATFALLEAGEQDRRVAAWGRLLAELAREGSPVGRPQWVHRAVPDTGEALARFWAEAGGHGSRAAAASYRQLITAAGPVTQRHETYLALPIDARRARRAVRAAGGGDTGACVVLLREVAAVQDRLVEAGLQVVGWLPPRALAQVLRSAYEPLAAARLDARPGTGPGAGVHPGVAGPMAARAGWSAYRSDDGWHATYWVHEWPRLGVGADFLTPLLLHASCRRTVALHAQPIPPRQAVRRATSARTAGLADQALRERVGQVTTERAHAEAAHAAAGEAELVAGHAEFRFSGFVTVTAATPAELEEACGQVEHAAHQSYLEIRRLHGEQDQAFTYTLPLARGPR